MKNFVSDNKSIYLSQNKKKRITITEKCCSSIHYLTPKRGKVGQTITILYISISFITFQFFVPHFLPKYLKNPALIKVYTWQWKECMSTNFDTFDMG